MLKIFTVLILTLLVMACAPSQKSEQNAKSNLVKCPTQRAQMCTREYAPVCATRDTGVRCVAAPCPALEYLTFGNACTACADAKVIEYQTGACAQTNGQP